MLQVEADPHELARLWAQAGRLASRDAQRGMSGAMGAAALAQVRDGFQRGVDPNDRPWPPSIRVRQFGGKTLIATGALMGSFAVEATPEGFRLFTAMNRRSASVRFARTHQYGAVIRANRPWLGRPPRPMLLFRPAGRRGTAWAMRERVVIPARPMLPEGQLSPRYRRTMNAAAAEFLERLVKGA